jgi:hypothetical protein
MSTDKLERVSFLDTFRFVAVTFALLAHVATQHGFDLYDTDSGLVSKALTRSATPSLLIVFGVMLEIVYGRRFADKPDMVASRMLYRATLCYVAFVASAFIAFLAGKKSLESVAGAATLLTSVQYTLIFKLYFFLLIAGVGIVAVRVRYGMASLLVLVGLVWLADLAYISESRPLPQPFRNLGGVLFGLGDTFGPSVLHSITFVAFGMALGGVAFARRSSRAARAAVALLLVLAAAALAWEVRSSGLRQVMVGIATEEMSRNSNDVVYYAYGLWAAVALMGLAYVVHLAAPAWLRRVAATLGSETFAYFFIGNAILLALPRFEVHGALSVAALFAAYLLVFCGVTLVWVSRARDSLPLLSRVEAWGQARMHAWTTNMARHLAGVARGSQGGGLRG